jgi:outer membrane receptor protein involved in Fe transport
VVVFAQLTATFLASPLTFAIDTQTTDPNPANDAQLQEVVVTAQRRDENIEKVPVSMTALSQGTLDDLHIESLSDIASLVPGVVLPPRPSSGAQGLNEVSIRGVQNLFNAPTTATYIDDTPVISQLNVQSSSTGSPQPIIFDLERVEVLRGPQGTLFGQGAMGGAIRYITPQPNLYDSSGYAKAEFSYTETGSPNYAAGAAYGAPIVSGELGFRLSGWFQSEGGFIDLQDPYTGEALRHDINKDHSFVVRQAMTWAPSEGLTITPAAYISYQHSDAPNQYWRNYLPQSGVGYITGSGYSGFPQTLADRLEIFSLVADYSFGGASFHSSTSYTYRNENADDDYSTLLPVDFGLSPLDPHLQDTAYGAQNEQRVRAWQQEFRLQSNEPGARLTWLLGAYFRHDADQFSQLFPGDLTPITKACCNSTSIGLFGVPNYIYDGQSYAGYTASTSTLQQEAAFADLTYELFPHLKASAGVRVEHMSLYNQRQQLAGPIDSTTAFSTVDLPDTSQTPVTPRYSLAYQYTETGMVYVAAAKGFRVGGSNNVAINSNPTCKPGLEALGYPNGSPTTFNSDSLWSYELGAKESLFNQKLAIQASIYYIDWSGIQQTLQPPGCNGAFTTNVGKVVSQGFDLQVAAIPVKGLTLGANVGYDHAYYPDSLYGATLSGGAPPLRVGAGDLLSLPPWTAAANAEYAWSFRPWDGAQSYARFDYRWTDAYSAQDTRVAGANVAVLLQPNEAYSLFNLRLGVRRAGLDVSAFVSNATNSEPRLGIGNATIGDPRFLASAIQPRTYGLTLLSHF